MDSARHFSDRTPRHHRLTLRSSGNCRNGLSSLAVCWHSWVCLKTQPGSEAGKELVRPVAAEYNPSSALTFVGKKYKVYRLKRKELKAAKASGVVKVLLIGLFLSGVSVAASAQDGFFKKLIDPVTPERIELKQQQTFKGEDPIIETDASAWFFRGAAVISGVKFHHSTADGKFIASEFIRAGAGIEFAHYGVKDVVAINDYWCWCLFYATIPGDPTQQYASIMVAGTI